MAKKVERGHRRDGMLCMCAECVMERGRAAKQFVETYGCSSDGLAKRLGIDEEGARKVVAFFDKTFPGALDAARVKAAQTYVALHGTEVYTGDRRCMVASCDGGHLDRDQATSMADRIARLLTEDEVARAHARHSQRRAGATGRPQAVAKITGIGDEELREALRPSEDYVFAVEDLKTKLEALAQRLFRAKCDRKEAARYICGALEKFSESDPNRKQPKGKKP